MKKIIAIAFLFLLSPTLVSANELWVKNEGGLEIVVNCDGGATVKADSGICVINPDWAEGQAKVAAADIHEGWVVITADNITSWDVEIACGQDFLDVIPEVRLVKDAPNPVTFDGISDGGKSIQSMNIEQRIAEYNATYDWTGIYLF